MKNVADGGLVDGAGGCSGVHREERLDQLQVVVAEVVQDETVDGRRQVRELVRLHPADVRVGFLFFDPLLG